MRIAEAYSNGQFGLSFELFPPKTAASEEELFRNLDELMRFHPSFVTCTYGAGGSTRDKTLEIVDRVQRTYSCTVASHLTCVEATVEQIRTYLQETKDRGIENIVALRGDPPKGQETFKPVKGGFAYANELVAFIRDEFPDFGIAVAGYPETHQEAPSSEIDLTNLKRKVDAGGDVVITQLFYENEDFFRFRELCERQGINVPIVPGILPVTSYKQIQRITSLCKANLPRQLVSELEKCGEDGEAQIGVGINHAIRQVQDLMSGNIPGIHFYVLNRSHATSKVLKAVL